MAVPIYRPQKFPNDAWFRTQRTANPMLFQPCSKRIPTLPAHAIRKEPREDHKRTGDRFEEPRPQIDVMPVQEVTYWLRHCRDTRNPHIPLAHIARAAGLSRMTIWRALTNANASLAVCLALTPVPREIAGGAAPGARV
jgi:hypothetical protein